jgi:hypothetical protein
VIKVIEIGLAIVLVAIGLMALSLVKVSDDDVEEFEESKDEVGARRLKRSEIIARNRIAVNYIRKNKHLSREELINYLVVELKFVRGTALRLTRENGKLRETKPNPFGTGKGLRAYLDKQEAEEQKAYERKMLEEELSRPKFFF